MPISEDWMPKMALSLFVDEINVEMIERRHIAHIQEYVGKYPFRMIVG